MIFLPLSMHPRAMSHNVPQRRRRRPLRRGARGGRGRRRRGGAAAAAAGGLPPAPGGGLCRGAGDGGHGLGRDGLLLALWGMFFWKWMAVGNR